MSRTLISRIKAVFTDRDKPFTHIVALLARRLNIFSSRNVLWNGFKILFNSNLSVHIVSCGDKLLESDNYVYDLFLKEGDVAIDIGANIGLSAMYMSRLVGPGGMVISFEAHPAKYEKAVRNINLNNIDNISIHNHLISSEKKNVSFSDKHSDARNQVVDNDESNSALHLTSVTLDDVVGEPIKRVKLIKIDVEGHELQVLKGGGVRLFLIRQFYF